MAAALVQDQAALELAATLDPTEIPTKLRCAVCNKLAVNAFKLPCCDQAICQYCQAALPESCPVCSHSPLEADMCKPHKALRMTIKVHLKTEEKKRAAAAAKSATPARVEDIPAPVAAALSESQQPEEVPAEYANGESELDNGDVAAAAPGVIDPMAQVEEVSATEQPLDPAYEGQPPPENIDAVNQTPGVEGEDVMQTTENEEQHVNDGNEQQQDFANDEQPQDVNQAQSTSDNPAFDGSKNNFQNNMDWNGTGFNPMMNMPNMQAGWAGFNNMMPMQMGQMPMFGGFGAAGMAMNDMSGMNMGMGFGGSFGGNWNGQQQQQGMGGNFGAGYYPNAGYNQPQMHQGAYGNQMHNQQFPNHNYQNRYQGQRGGYGRGGSRGGFGGRGGLHVNQFQGPHMQPHNQGQYGTPQPDNAAFAQQLPDGVQGDRLPSHSVGESGHQTSEMPDDQAAMPVDENQMQDVSGPDATADVAVHGDTNTDGQVPHENGDGGDYHGGDMQVDDGMQQGLAYGNNGINPGRMNMVTGQEFGHDMTQQYPTEPGQADGFYGANNNFQPGFGYRGRGGFRGRGRGRGGWMTTHHDAYTGNQDNFTVVAGVDAAPPINAPTGPKAMREGKPNTGFYSRSVPPPVQAPQSTTSHKERSPSPAKTSRPEPELEQPAEDMKSRSRSRSTDRKRKYRQRSTSAAHEDDEASERRRERRRHHEEEYEEERRDDPMDGDSSSRKDRSRASSPRDGSRSHRSRRDKDKYRSSRSQRDSSREHGRDRHRHRSRSPARADEKYTNGTEEVHSESSRRRERRDRDHGRDRGDREREREKEKSRKRSSRRDRSISPPRDKDDKPSSSRRDRRDRDREDMAPPASDDQGFKIKGSRSAKPPASAPTGPASSFAPPTGPKKDRERDRGSNRNDRERERERSDRDRPREGKQRDREPERSSRRPSTQSVAVTDAPAPIIDIHAQEREARNRERMLKEQQRRESASTAMGKRPRGSTDEVNGDTFDPPTGPRAAPTGPRAERRESAAGERDAKNKKKRGRKMYKYEDDEHDERRAAKIEEEREASRWD